MASFAALRESGCGINGGALLRPHLNELRTRHAHNVASSEGDPEIGIYGTLQIIRP
jgi:hypothetical protein